MFNPFLEEMIQFDEHIFQMGCNHQPDTHGMDECFTGDLQVAVFFGGDSGVLMFVLVNTDMSGR